MRLVKMLADFLKKFLLLSAEEQTVLTRIRADVGRKREYGRNEGFIRVKSPYIGSAMAFVYEPSMDFRLKKIHMTGPYFRVWFTVEKNGDVYFVNFTRVG